MLLYTCSLVQLLFTTVADALVWILFKKRVSHVAHYMNDFIFAGAPKVDKCANYLSKVLHTFSELSVPIEPQKISRSNYLHPDPRNRDLHNSD